MLFLLYFFRFIVFYFFNASTRFPEIAQYFPWTIDGPEMSDKQVSLTIDIVLVSIFAIQHIIMARKWWKKIFNSIFSEASERSTYVLASTLALHLLMNTWHPINDIIWKVPDNFNVIADLVCLFGWIIVLLATFNIDHFLLFGLKQSIGIGEVSTEFSAIYLYKYIRHPIMTGFLIAFWATPEMTMGHFVYAAMCTGFIFFTVTFFEEPDLTADIPEYTDYMKTVPSYCPMLGMSYSPKKKK